MHPSSWERLSAVTMDVYTRQYKNTSGEPSENEKYDRQKALRSPSYERSAKYFYPACTKCRLQARHKMQVTNERTLRHRSTLLLSPSGFISRFSRKSEAARSLQGNLRWFLPKLFWQSRFTRGEFDEWVFFCCSWQLLCFRPRPVSTRKKYILARIITASWEVFTKGESIYYYERLLWFHRSWEI